MEKHKGIEDLIYLHLKKYPVDTRIIEVGIGKNPYIAEKLKKDGYDIRASDVNRNACGCGIKFQADDVFEPDMRFYQGADLIYSVRPGIEMIPPLMAVAENAGAELIVYHLGCEIYKNGGEIIDCGVILHKYYRPPK